MITWHCCEFNQLTPQILYSILKARCDVFVVEQNCVYPDIDGIDTQPDTYHLYAMNENQVVAYARLIPPNVAYTQYSSIGRVLITEPFRKNKLGHVLIKKAIDESRTKWPNINIKISAQAYLKKFYSHHGFTPISDIYMEDGIEHLAMLLKV